MNTPETPAIEPLVLDIPEAALALRLGVSTVRKMVAVGTLKSIRIGNRHLFRPEDLRAFIAERAAVLKFNRPSPASRREATTEELLK
jgi:excisionase family DNA binding protein